MLYESNHSECNIDNTSTARTTTYLRRLEVSSVIVLSLLYINKCSRLYIGVYFFFFFFRYSLCKYNIQLEHEFLFLQNFSNAFDVTLVYLV